MSNIAIPRNTYYFHSLTCILSSVCICPSEYMARVYTSCKHNNNHIAISAHAPTTIIASLQGYWGKVPAEPLWLPSTTDGRRSGSRLNALNHVTGT